MLRLRPFKASDIKHLLEWVKDERTFTMWCANKFTYPLTEEQLIEYKNMFDQNEFAWSFTAINEQGIPVGHFMMRNADYVKQSIHLGFVIVDDKYRGQGYGKEMIGLAIQYAFHILKVKKMTLCVFEGNPSAHNCYKSVGFIDTTFHEDFFPFHEEKWGLQDMEITG